MQVQKKRYKLEYLEMKMSIGGMKAELTLYLDLEEGLRALARPWDCKWVLGILNRFSENSSTEALEPLLPGCKFTEVTLYQTWHFEGQIGLGRGGWDEGILLDEGKHLGIPQWPSVMGTKEAENKLGKFIYNEIIIILCNNIYNKIYDNWEKGQEYIDFSTDSQKRTVDVSSSYQSLIMGTR